MKWDELTSRRLASVDRGSVCVLPLGAVEQHGPHLPLGTDAMIARALADRLDVACGDRLLVTPGPPSGCSDHHMGFPGTLTLRHETFLTSVVETVGSMVGHGFRRFFLLNAHGGNSSIGGVISERAARDWPEAEVVFATWFRVAADRLRPLVEGAYPAVGHACEFETSLILALRPDLVDRDVIADDGLAPASPLLHSDLLTGGVAVRAVPFERITRSGVWGKPSLATAEKGEAILKITVSALKDLLTAYWPDAPGIAGPGSAAANGGVRSHAS